MNLFEKLKEIDFLRRKIKKIKIWREYIFDAKSFCKYYMEEADKKGEYEYRMLMLVHNIEKGMCMPKPRPFGKKKIKDLMMMIESCERNSRLINASCYKMSLSIIYQWRCFYDQNGWKNDIKETITDFLSKRNINGYENLTGFEYVEKERLFVKLSDPFEKVVSTRKSVRSFSGIALYDEDVKQCIRIAQAAPTACNRQMIGIIQVSDRDMCDLITDTIYGSGGITRETVNYFVITYDIRSLDYYGERNQGFLNAGLVAMSFVNALHCKGIESCFLQWANAAKEDRRIRKALCMLDSERIAVVIACGYSAESLLIARSNRKEVAEIYRKI